MGYQYTTVDGQRVEKNTAAALAGLAAAFKAAWGLDLIVTSGTRTRTEQQKLYDGWIRRLPGYSLAARPGFSNHEEFGPTGPRAVDVRDSGADAGVTVANSSRAKWLRANAGDYGFVAAGYGFHPVEPWHIEFRGVLAGDTTKPAGVAISSTVKNQQAWLNHSRGEKLAVDGLIGPKTIAAFKRYQLFLGVSTDGIWGPKTQTAHQAYYDRVNAPRPAVKKTTASFGRVDVVQRALRKKYPLYAGRLAVDNVDGPRTIAAVKEFQRRAGLVVDGIAGPATRRALGV